MQSKLLIPACRICHDGQGELLLADVALSIQHFAFTTLITSDFYCIWVITILSEEKFCLCLFSIFSISRIRKINGVDLLKYKIESSQRDYGYLKASLPMKSWIQSTDWSDKVTSLRHKRMFRGKQKGERKGIVGNWTPTTTPQHTQTLPFKEHMASSLIPLHQAFGKDRSRCCQECDCIWKTN